MSHNTRITAGRILSVLVLAGLAGFIDAAETITQTASGNTCN
ncbi:MAG: hypothetical protein ACKVHE_20035 [Planctomycetales bacterium]